MAAGRWRAVLLLALWAPLMTTTMPVMATQTVTFSGVVEDAINNVPIVGATVTINGVSSVTIAGGHYSVTLPAGTVFHAAVSAPGYLTSMVVLSKGSIVWVGPQQFNFVGSFGLTPASGATTTISGVVRDADTGQVVPRAVVICQDTEVTTGPDGRYTVTVTTTPSLTLYVTALGYHASGLVKISETNHQSMVGNISLDFTDSRGLHSLFRALNGDSLSPFLQVVPASTRSITIDVISPHAMLSVYGITYPDGYAVERPMTTDQGHSQVQLTLDHGPGVYNVEIDAADGAQLFAMPIYYGIPYRPLAAPPLYAADPANMPAPQLEATALVLLNAFRAQYKVPALPIDPRVIAIARAHSVDLVAHNSFTVRPHIGSDGSTPASRLHAGGLVFDQVAEDVVIATSIRQGLESLWGGAAHRAHALATMYTSVGIGVVRDKSGNIVMTLDYLSNVPVHQLLITQPIVPVLASIEAGPTTAGVLALAITVEIPGQPAYTQDITLVAPAGALTTTARLGVGVFIPGPGQIAALVRDSHNNLPLGVMLSLTATSTSGQPLHLFNRQHPIIVQTTFDSAELHGQPASSLHLTYFDPATGIWHNLPTSVGIGSSTIIAATTHFTLFQVRASSRSQASIGKARQHLAALAAAGKPHVTVLGTQRLAPGQLPVIVSILKGKQGVPITAEITGPPHGTAHVTWRITGSRTVVLRSLSLNSQGYGVTAGFSPPSARTSRFLTASVTVSIGRFKRTIITRTKLMPTLVQATHR